MPLSRLAPLLQQALEFVPDENRERASKVAIYFQVGYGTIEIASEMGLSWKQVADLRSAVQAGIVKAVEANGYRPAETIRYLGVPTAAYRAAKAA